MKPKSSPRRLKEYAVNALITVSVYTIIHAHDAEEALELAGERAVQSVCHQCSSGDPETEWSLNDGLDGTPMDLTLDDEV